MKKSFTFKKIIPSLLIVAIFSISVFSTFMVGVRKVEAQSVFDQNNAVNRSDFTTNIVKDINTPATDQELRDFIIKRYPNTHVADQAQDPKTTRTTSHITVYFQANSSIRT